jgi:hypothetical protein
MPKFSCNSLRWRDTPSVGRTGFVQSRLLWNDPDGEFPSQEVATVTRHGHYYVEFTRFAPKEVVEDWRTHEGTQFESLEEAKAYAMALVVLS